MAWASGLRVLGPQAYMVLTLERQVREQTDWAHRNSTRIFGQGACGYIKVYARLLHLLKIFQRP